MDDVVFHASQSLSNTVFLVSFRFIAFPLLSRPPKRHAVTIPATNMFLVPPHREKTEAAENNFHCWRNTVTGHAVPTQFETFPYGRRGNLSLYEGSWGSLTV